MRSRDCYFKKNDTTYIVPKLFQNAACVQQRIKIYAMEECWHSDSCTICFGRKDHLTFIMTSRLFHKIDSPVGFFLKSFASDLCVCINEFDLIVLWQRYPWLGEGWVKCVFCYIMMRSSRIFCSLLCIHVQVRIE